MIRNLLISLSTILLLCGCTKEKDSFCCPEHRRMVIDAEILDGVSKEDFEPGDTIGIYQVFYVNGEPGVLGNISDPLNVPYLFDGSWWNPASGEDLFLGDGIASDIYAYFPYDEQMSRAEDKLNLGAYPFDVKQDQQEGFCDFLWAKTTLPVGGSNQTRLGFSHLLTRLVINLNYGSAAADDPEPDMEVHNTLNRAVIDLRTGTVIRAEGNAYTLTPLLRDEPEPEYDFTYEVVIAPQTLPAGTPLFSVEYLDETLLYFLDTEIDFQGGRSYTFNLVLETLFAGEESSSGI